MSNIDEFDDAALKKLIQSAPKLRSLRCVYTEVTRQGFELLEGASALPELRVVEYWNSFCARRHAPPRITASHTP